MARRIPFRWLVAAAALLLAVRTPLVQVWAQSGALPPRPDYSNAPVLAVERIIDDRTVALSDGRHGSVVRMIGVAAAAGEAPRRAAEAFLSQLLLGEKVYILEVPEAESNAPRRGERGRPGGAGADRAAEGDSPPTLAYLFRAPDGLFVNLELVRQGYAACAAQPEFAQRDAFRAAERTARAARKGIWSLRGGPAPATTTDRPAASASQPTADPSGQVYVTRSGKKYHRADCVYAKNGATAIPLEQARKSYEPCSRCKPPR